LGQLCSTTAGFRGLRDNSGKCMLSEKGLWIVNNFVTYLRLVVNYSCRYGTSLNDHC